LGKQDVVLIGKFGRLRTCFEFTHKLPKWVQINFLMFTVTKSGARPSLDDFIILKVIGRGVMGKVMLVKHKISQNLYALKSIHKQWILSHGHIRFTQSERAILAAFRDSFNMFKDGDSKDLSNFLIRLHASFQTETEIFYVLDYHSGGDLASILGQESRLGEAKAKFFAAEIAVGLGILHTHGIIYRDLKPENVLIDDRGHIVLTDFGVSKILKPPGCDGNAKTSTFCGTAEYLAPELLKGEPYDQSVDWWTYGTMLYEMITGITPYWCEVPATMYRRILNDPFLEFPTYVSPAARDLIIKVS
jgi:serine/threonine protein kinase